MIDSSHVLSSYPILDSLGMFQNNVVAGNVSGGLRALVKPGEASLEERRTISDRMGLTGTIYAPLVDVATNPLVLLGAALTWKFGLPTALELRAYKGPADALRRSALPLLEGLSSQRVVFQGTPIPYDLEEAVGRHVGVVSGVMEKLDKLWKQAPVPTRDSWQRIVASLDGLDQPLHTNLSVDKLVKALSDDTMRTTMGMTHGDALGVIRKLQATPSLVGPLNLTPEEQIVKRGIREIFDDLWGNVLSKTPEDKKTRDLMRALLGGDIGVPTKASEYTANYFPRFMKESEAEAASRLNRWIEGLTPQALRPEAEAINRRNAAAMGGPFESHRLDFRSGHLMPDTAILKEMGVDPEITAAMDRYATAFAGGKQYDLAPDVIRRYADVAGRVNAWAIPPAEGSAPIGDRMLQSLGGLLSGDLNSKMKGMQLRNTYIPLLLGRMTPNNLAWSATWEAQKENVARGISSLTGAGVLPPRLAQQFSQSLLQDRNWSYPAAGQNISNFFYANTLGGNVTSAMKNLMQTVTTLLPTVGLENFTTGLRETVTGWTRYLKYIHQDGLSTIEGFEKAFPEFHQMHLELDPAGRHALGQALDDAYQSALPLTKEGSSWHQIQSKLLSLFSKTETFNRVAAFYSSRAKAVKDFGGALGTEVYDSVRGEMTPLTKENIPRFANIWAKENTNRTMFGPGVLNRPSAIADWWAPHRQFLSYPMGTAGLLLNEGLQNPGVAARMLLYSGLTYAGGRALLGQDTSDALIFGANPIAKGDRPFAPFPAPPLLNLAGGLAQATTGNFEALKSAIPTLVPGGVAASRIPGLLGFSGASAVTGKPYVDYSRPSPDGRYPMYTAGGSLLGFATPMDIAARAFGITQPSEQQAREINSLLMGSQDRVQQLRRSAMEALADNDAERLVSLSAEWQRVFPGSGELPVSQEDIRNIHMRQDVTRTERLLETLPPQIRSQYAAILSTAVTSDFPAYLGLTNDLGAGNTITEREAFRTRPIGATADRVGPSLHGVKLSDKMKDAGLNQPAPPPLMGGASFNGFSGFTGANQ